MLKIAVLKKHVFVIALLMWASFFSPLDLWMLMHLNLRTQRPGETWTTLTLLPQSAPQGPPAGDMPLRAETTAAN